MDNELCVLDTYGIPWDDMADAGLVLHPVAYGEPLSMGECPVVTFHEFARYVAANWNNDPNGTWGDVLQGVDENGRGVMLHVPDDAQEHGITRTGEDTCTVVVSELDYYVDCWSAGEGGTYELSGWTFVRRRNFA